MKLVSIKNALTGALDLAPLKDVDGRTLALRGNETREITEEDLGHPIIQRVLHAKWLVVIDATATPETPPPAPVKPPPTPVIKAAAPPEELMMPPALEHVETTMDAPQPPASISETPTTSRPAKPTKNPK